MRPQCTSTYQRDNPNQMLKIAKKITTGKQLIESIRNSTKTRIKLPSRSMMPINKPLVILTLLILRNTLPTKSSSKPKNTSIPTRRTRKPMRNWKLQRSPIVPRIIRPSGERAGPKNKRTKVTQDTSLTSAHSPMTPRILSLRRIAMQSPTPKRPKTVQRKGSSNS